MTLQELRNSRVMKSSYETELCKMTSHFELLTRSRKIKLTLRVTNSKSKNKNLHLELLTRRFNFYFSNFELLTRN